MNPHSPEFYQLLEVLAEIEVRNYLYPQTSNDGDSGGCEPNPPDFQATGEAA